MQKNNRRKQQAPKKYNDPQTIVAVGTIYQYAIPYLTYHSFILYGHNIIIIIIIIIKVFSSTSLSPLSFKVFSMICFIRSQAHRGAYIGQGHTEAVHEIKCSCCYSLIVCGGVGTWFLVHFVVPTLTRDVWILPYSKFLAGQYVRLHVINPPFQRPQRSFNSFPSWIIVTERDLKADSPLRHNTLRDKEGKKGAKQQQLGCKWQEKNATIWSQTKKYFEGLSFPSF